MEFPVCFFIGLLNTHDPLHTFVENQIIGVNIGGVAYKSQNGASNAVGNTYF